MSHRRRYAMLEYNMDLAPGSYSHPTTPDVFVQTLPFYVTDCGKFITGEHYYTKREGLSHYSYLLIVTESGYGRISWHGQKCILEPGSAVLIDCSTYQEYAPVPNCGWNFYFLHFHGHSMDGYKNMLLNELTPVRLRAPDAVYQSMEHLHHLIQENNVISYAVQSNAVSNLLTEMLCSLAAGQDNNSGFNRADIAGLAEYIKENCTKELHIDELSGLTHLSKNHLIRIFKKQIGMSPYQYMHLCRINRAQQLLRTTDLSVTQIAYMSGYHDPVVFIRHFTAFNHITPGKYRDVSIVFSADSL